MNLKHETISAFVKGLPLGVILSITAMVVLFLAASAKADEGVNLHPDDYVLVCPSEYHLYTYHGGGSVMAICWTYRQSEPVVIPETTLSGVMGLALDSYENAVREHWGPLREGIREEIPNPFGE